MASIPTTQPSLLRTRRQASCGNDTERIRRTMSEATAEMTFSPKAKKIGDEIAGLTIIEAVELKEYLKVTYKIEPAAGGVVMAGGGGAAAAEKPAEKTEFTVMLMGFDAAKKINVIKEV